MIESSNQVFTLKSGFKRNINIVNLTPKGVLNIPIYLDRKAQTRCGGSLAASAPVGVRRKVLLTGSML